jgi:hypothetical protein
VSFTLDTDADRVAAGLSAVGVQLGDLEPVNTTAGAVVRAAAFPPQRTGGLSASLRSVVEPGGVTWGSDLSYATFVHWGAPGHHQRAQPFLLQALEVSTTELAELYRQHAVDAIADNL